MKSTPTLHQAGRCRFCGTPLAHTFVDLGMSPLSNAFIRPENYHAMEPFYPLHAYVCGSCFLVQLEEFESPQQIFSDYAYFSSYSESWLRHAKAYTELMIRRFGFNASHQVIEIASNDGYLLRNFKEHGIPVLGIEPERFSSPSPTNAVSRAAIVSPLIASGITKPVISPPPWPS